MSNLRAMAFALLAILVLASCAADRGSEGPRREPREVVDPSAGMVTYKEKTIVFDEAADPPLLTIDGRPIKVSRTRTPGHTRYHTSAMIYVDFTSLWQLARALVDSRMLEYAAAR
jgi:hypothetical protein